MAGQDYIDASKEYDQRQDRTRQEQPARIVHSLFFAVANPIPYYFDALFDVGSEQRFPGIRWGGWLFQVFSQRRHDPVKIKDRCLGGW